MRLSLGYLTLLPKIQRRNRGVLAFDRAPFGQSTVDTTPADEPQPYRQDIDGLRAVAVLLVIAFHAVGRWVPGGFVGVDVFFVISGFLISTIIFKALDDGRFSFATFYARRIRRIFPALVTVLAAAAAAGWVLLVTDGYKQLGKDITAGAAFVSNIYLWRQTGYFDGDIGLKPLVHLWSLGIEEQYYLCWPLAVFLIWKMGFSRLNLALSVLVVSFALNVGTVQFSPETAFYLPHTRFWELMVGSVLAYIQLYKNHDFDAALTRILRFPNWSRHLAEVKGWVGLLLLVAAVLFVNKESAFPGWWALLPTFGTFFLISAGEDAWLNRKLLGNRSLVFIGLISYPLYLWHWPLLSFLRIALGEPPGWTKMGALALAFPLAWMTYQFVEKPFRQKRVGARRVFAVPLLVSAMLAVMGLSAAAMCGYGLPNRYPEAVRQIAEYKADEHMPSWRKNQCFLQLNHGVSQFDSSCTDREPATNPLVFLWGDSHAADLYPGLRQLQSLYRFRIAQYSAAECLPLFNFEFPPSQRYCRGINDWVWQKIRELRPEVVMLAGQRWGETLLIHREFLSTLAMLKSSGVKVIVVVGPNPRWQDPLPRSLLLEYYRVGSLPDRMTYNLDQLVFEANRRLKNWVSETDAIYLSPVDLLCNNDGCLTKVQEAGASDLTAGDRHHFTDIASWYVAKRIVAPVFTPIFARQDQESARTSDSAKGTQKPKIH